MMQNHLEISVKYFFFDPKRAKLVQKSDGNLSLSPFSFLFYFHFFFFIFLSFAVFAFSAGASMTSAGASMRELLLMDSAIQQCNVDCRHCFGIGVGVGWVGN